MLKEHVGSIDFKVNGSVLILVLMEHAQRIRQEFVYDRRYYVLILILMEHAQRDMRKSFIVLLAFAVLILILMEHAQRANATTLIPW